MKSRMLILLLVLLGSGCATVDVKPWEKGYLAKNEMLIIPDPINATMRNHVFASKEAAKEGNSVGAGGCGCN